MRRKLSAIFLTGISAFALSGCIKLDMDMKVRADTKVDGTMIVAFSEEAMKSFEAMGASMGEGLNDKNSKTPTTKPKSFQQQTEESVKETQGKLPKGSKAKLYKKNGWIGQEISFSGVDAGVALSAGTSAGSTTGGTADTNKLSIVKKGDSLELNGVLDMGGDTGGADAGGLGDMSAMMGSTKPELKVKFTFPGKVTSASSGGKISGNSVTWTPVFGKKLIMKAVAKAK